MEYVIKLTQQEIQVIQMGLGELPLKIGIALLGNIQLQITKQDNDNAVSIKELHV